MWSATGSLSRSSPSATLLPNGLVLSAGGFSGSSVLASAELFSTAICAPPVISAISPISGFVGTSVTITGSSFEATQGASTVTFNGVTASVSSWSDTQIIATVPAGATTGSVVVTVNGVVSNNDKTFMVIQDTIAPTTMANVSPAANAAGWHNSDVTVTLSAVDNPGGSGVVSITYTLSGAQTGAGVVNGGNTSFAVTAEGVTTVTFHATDNAGNVEPDHTVTIRIDKTPPTITGSRTPAPNANGWNNTDVTVTFACSDGLSGIDTCGPTPQVVTTEGAGQSRTGTATDLAGNTASATVGGINIDKTPPVISGLPPAGCTIWPPNHKLVIMATVTGSDGGSGLAGAVSVTGVSNEPEHGLGDGDTAPDIVVAGGTVQVRAERSGKGTGRVYTITATVGDQAGNTSTATASCMVPHDQRR